MDSFLDFYHRSAKKAIALNSNSEYEFFYRIQRCGNAKLHMGGFNASGNPSFALQIRRWCGRTRIHPDEGIKPMVGYMLALLVGTIAIAAVPWVSSNRPVATH
ncbi:hypothetical protein [Bradyrhizobium sp.]|uniref:hypothetical protein n=1 Tax=Bradyrhizobium sp. TaxID=376 RepID=UPI003C792270